MDVPVSRTDPPARPSRTRVLTEKQRRFIDFYLGLSGGNATDAARRAGYGKTYASASELGSRQLRKVEIQHAIFCDQELRKARSIADARERDILLTKIIRDDSASTHIRIAAISALNRATGRYAVHRRQSNGKTLEQILTESRRA